MVDNNYEKNENKTISSLTGEEDGSTHGRYIEHGYV